MTNPTDRLIRRDLGLVEYLPTWEAMRAFTARRGPDTPDEVWFLQHPPVYTLGLNGRPEHLLAPGDIPVVETDRGGQVTYHGPGQLVAYLLVDARRRGLGVREMVEAIEHAVIGLLAELGIEGTARRDAPGVYIDGAKVAALGLRFRKQGSYHGLSLNLDMDLAPFAGIDPCGYPDMPVTRLKDHGVDMDIDTLADRLYPHLCADLGYTMPSRQAE